MRKRALANPPAELLCVPQRTTKAALCTACAHTLRGVYHMLHKFQVSMRPGGSFLACFALAWASVHAEACLE